MATTEPKSLSNLQAIDSLLSSSLQLWPMALRMQVFLYLADCAIRDSWHLPLLLQAPNNSPTHNRHPILIVLHLIKVLAKSQN